MRKILFIPIVLVVALCVANGFARVGDAAPMETASVTVHETGTAHEAEVPAVEGEAPVPPDGCAPAYRSLFDQAVVELTGTGEADVVIVSDPLCWHCRLGNKLLSEYPNFYKRLRISFFPRRGFIGSDMAAWILEDVAGTDRLRPMVSFAYTDLKQPKTDDLMTARMLVLVQFSKAFPELLKDTTIEALYVRLKHDHEDHVMESVMLAKAAQLPGTPVLITGKRVILGFGPGQWLEAMQSGDICK